MKFNKSLITTFAVFILSNVLTTVWYMVTDEANYVPYRRDEPNYGLLVLNHLIFAIGFVHLFPSYYQQHKKLVRGFVYGVIMAGIMFIPTALVVRGIWKVDVNTIFFLNTLAHLLIGGIMGVTSALIFDYKNKGLS